MEILPILLKFARIGRFGFELNNFDTANCEKKNEKDRFRPKISKIDFDLTQIQSSI